jgi:hypothetical protein
MVKHGHLNSSLWGRQAQKWHFLLFLKIHGISGENINT